MTHDQVDLPSRPTTFELRRKPEVAGRILAGGDFLVKDLMEDLMVDLVLHFFFGGGKKEGVCSCILLPTFNEKMGLSHLIQDAFKRKALLEVLKNTDLWFWMAFLGEASLIVFFDSETFALSDILKIIRDDSTIWPSTGRLQSSVSLISVVGVPGGETVFSRNVYNMLC